jgi:A/G-specific adenine glycosylase
LREDCRAILAGDPELLPVKNAKPEKPQRRGAAYVAIRNDGAILLRTRPEKGLLGGMSEVPTTNWTARVDGDTSANGAPFAADWRRAGSISHVFTHFALELDVYRAEVDGTATPDGHWWSSASAVHDEALPTVMKKVIGSAIPGATKRKH